MYSGYFPLHNVSPTADCIMSAEWLSTFVKTLRVQKLVQRFHPAQLQEGGNLVWHKPSHWDCCSERYLSVLMAFKSYNISNLDTIGLYCFYRTEAIKENIHPFKLYWKCWMMNSLSLIYSEGHNVKNAIKTALFSCILPSVLTLHVSWQFNTYRGYKSHNWLMVWRLSGIP